MKKVIVFALIMISSLAYAFQATLTNEDSRRYDYKLKCVGTLNTYIAGKPTTYLRSGCTLIIEGVGSAEIKDDMKCVIKNGVLSCR
jgi:hypothetical protein